MGCIDTLSNIPAFIEAEKSIYRNNYGIMVSDQNHHLTYVCPRNDGTIDTCITHVLSAVSQIYSERLEEDLKVEYFNNTLPNKLFECIKKSSLYHEERLMKSIDYRKSNNLIHLIEMVKSPRPSPHIVVIENLHLLITATKLDYPSLNERLMHLLMFLKRAPCQVYIVDPSRHHFVDINCIDSVVV